MFTALRRFSILFMMILEIYLPMGLTFTTPVRISVGVIVLGGIVAALNDLAFDFVVTCLSWETTCSVLFKE